ncbi:hypothetical protein WR25_17789 [Diploscapter pachys]|uniref:Uncharacterized protein n=1 Tax=Diploscapter pachys TaxID=2018661 RepID=A0A2A2LF48_9BILA|nr:hypothetical protein WR25_17789 [Diploscapter pachys]
MMSVSTILHPSRPLLCHPEVKECPEGRNSQCVFSMKSFNYICCQDREDADKPMCPKYYETLLMTCGDNVDNGCPKGYKCMPSASDENLRICCKPNHSITYIEPETTFRENKIVPFVLPNAPVVQLNITFMDRKIKLAELVDVTQIEIFDEPPQVYDISTDDNKMYTLILIDATTGTVNWLVANIPSIDGKLDLSRRTRAIISYVQPDVSDKPEGIHVLVLLLFEQKTAWQQRELSRVPADDFAVRDWIANNKHILDETPLAGTFYGVTKIFFETQGCNGASYSDFCSEICSDSVS